MSLLAQLAIALALFVGGFAGGIKWHAGVDAQRELEARNLRDSDARQQRQFSDLQAGRHAAALTTLQTQLGDARENIARLSGRACLDGNTVGLLNATGVHDRAAAGDVADPTTAASTGANDRVATDRDVAGYIALCRTRYAEVSDQLAKILDIEDRRHPPGAAVVP